MQDEERRYYYDYFTTVRFWILVVVYLEIFGANVSAGKIICCVPMTGCVMKEIK
jgi:hypothetical protein